MSKAMSLYASQSACKSYDDVRKKSKRSFQKTKRRNNKTSGCLAV